MFDISRYWIYPYTLVYSPKVYDGHNRLVYNMYTYRSKWLN